jgi:HEAT repeat protein
MMTSLSRSVAWCVLWIAPLSLAGRALSQEPPTAPPKTAASASQPTAKQRAWRLLRSGVNSTKTDQRATAVGVLALMRGQRPATTMATEALGDKSPKVRVAAAGALGELHATKAIPKLKDALNDQDVSVVLAAAHALLLLKDSSAYDVYFAILTGQRKGGHGLLAGQLETLKDPKKMALLGFQEGIGFIPFAGMGYGAVRAIMKDDSSPVRAAAARVLAADPDADTLEGLANASLDDKSELVRTAALEAVARHDDPAYISKIAPAMDDEKDPVKFTAAAAVIRLTAIAERRAAAKSK